MNKFLTLAVIGAALLLHTASGFAQQSDFYSFQLTVRQKQKQKKFLLSGYYGDTTSMKPRILKDYHANPHSALSELYSAESIYVKGKDTTRWYILYEIGYPEHYNENKFFVYNEKGKRLYTLEEVLQTTQEQNAQLEKLAGKYQTPADSSHRMFSLVTSGGKKYYVMEYDGVLNEPYTLPESAYAAYGEYKLRIITDTSFNVLSEQILIGDGSELRELQFVAPVQLP